MNVRPFVPFVLAFAANVVWQGFLLLAQPIPRGWADNYADAAAGWIFPSIANLVVLYRNQVFVRWPRVGRVAMLCFLSAAAAHIALAVVITLLIVGNLAVHGIPKPNQRIEPMRRSAFRLVPHSGAVDALLLMAHPWR